MQLVTPEIKVRGVKRHLLALERERGAVMNSRETKITRKLVTVVRDEI